MTTQGLDSYKQLAYAEYDFAKDGGAVGDHTLRGTPLPVGAVVLGAYIDVETAVTSGGLRSDVLGQAEEQRVTGVLGDAFLGQIVVDDELHRSACDRAQPLRG